MRLEKVPAETESALRKSEEHFRLLVEQASDGIFVSDAEGRYIDVNTAGAQMLGYTRDEILKLSICDVIAPSEVERLLFEIGRFARRGRCPQRLVISAEGGFVISWRSLWQATAGRPIAAHCA